MRYVAPWLVLFLAACSPRASTVASTRSALTGQDGDKTVANGEVVNLYRALAADAAAGATSLTVTDATGYAAGDMVLVVGVQGATIDTSDSAAYGTVSALGAAGANELWLLASVTGNVLGLDTSCGLTGLANAYPLASHPQVVRVPQYKTLTVPIGVTLTGKPWDGATGGFIAAHVQTTADIEGIVDASGLGLRPGNPAAGTASPGGGVVAYRSASLVGGEKGESIAGSSADYDGLGGRYGRGAPANGGGGGDGYLGGGGGGANATTASGTYSGQGTMLSTVTGGSAWMLDPSFAQRGGPGAGRGGYTYSASNQDATQVGPGDASWSGDDREQVGGLGAHALVSGGRIFLGGGGGAAQLDGTTTASTDGTGGGVVFLVASSLTGAGSVRANGSDGRDGQLVGNGLLLAPSGNGGGGGGGGGVIALRTVGNTTLTVSAHGGAGGQVTTTGVFPVGVAPATGPGGGGAGGVIALGASLTIGASDIKGGLGGTTTASALSEFPSNGASAGDTGVLVTGVAAGAAPIACLPADVSIALVSSAGTVQAGTSYSYTATVTNSGPDAAYDLITTLTLPSGVTGGTITATGWSCVLVAQVLTCTQPVLLSGAVTTITIAATAPSTAGTITASAQVSSRQDPNAMNNSASTDVIVKLPEADLSLTFGAPTATASNETFTYTFAVVNNGPASAPSLQIVDVLPAGITFVSATGGGFTCTGTSTITCSHGALLATASSSVTLTVTAPPLSSTTDSLNSGTVSLTSSGVVDSSSANDTASGTTTITPVDLSMTKADLFDPVTTGGALSYTLTVQNPSNVIAHSVEVDDVLPVGTTFVSATGSGWTCGLDTPGTTIVCTRPTIAAVATRTISVALSAPTSATTVTNTATVKATATDPLVGNNTSTVQTTVNLPPPGNDDLSVTASGAPDPVALGMSLVYTVAIANAGPTTATAVQLVGTLPSTATYVSATGTGWTCTQSMSSLSCSLSDSVPIGPAAPLTITMTAPGGVGSIDAVFTVTAAQNDTVISNNTASVTTSVIDPAVPNQPPTLTVDRGLTTPEDTPLSLGTSITIGDPDSGSDPIELDITATSCVLTLSTTTGLQFLEGDGVLDPVLRVRASTAALTLALSGATLVPYPNFDGAASLTLHADDLGHDGAGSPGTADATLVVTVTPVDDPPIAVLDDFTVNANVSTTLDVLANDRIGQPGQILAVASVSPPAHGVATLTDGVVTYDPTPNYVGDDSFAYAVTDGIVQADATVTLHVRPYAPPTSDRLGGGAGCSAAPGAAGGPSGLFLLAVVYLMMRRSRNQSYCSPSAANTDVGR
ncbi:MAG: Ig-like domain-containing protein [Polyangia bacterium]